jgi:hypothetical protein
MSNKKITSRSKSGQISLHQLCSCLKGEVLVEIGSYAGESTAIFAKFFNKVYAIDPWSDEWKSGYSTEKLHEIKEKSPECFFTPMSDVERAFDENTKGFTNITKIKGFSESTEIRNQFPDYSIDVLYLDSIHTYECVKENLNLWLPKMKKDGIMAGHDYCPNYWPGVVKAVDEFFGKPEKTFADFSWMVNLK